MKEFNRLAERLKYIDIKVLERYIRAAKRKPDKVDLRPFQEKLQPISKKVEALYDEAGLVYNADKNRHL